MRAIVAPVGSRGFGRLPTVTTTTVGFFLAVFRHRARYFCNHEKKQPRPLVQSALRYKGSGDVGCSLLEHLEPLASHRRLMACETSDIAAQAERDWIQSRSWYLVPHP